MFNRNISPNIENITPLFTLIDAIPLQQDNKKQKTMEETKKKRSLKKGIVKTYIGIENAVVGSYKAIENGVVGGYKAIENGAAKGYKAVEDATVGAYKEIEDSAKNMGKSLVEEYNKQKSEKKSEQKK